MYDLIRKSIASSFLISLGVYVLLKVGEPLGAFLFSFGLLSICYLKLNLFTGKAGYLISQRIYKALPIILISNLISGYIFGIMIRLCGDETVIQNAYNKVSSWECTPGYFIKAMLCGAIMYLCVEIYNSQKSILGILFGIPLFILCGFQHSIANVIILGIVSQFSWALILAIIGNLIGSLFIWYITKS